jgi:hypothetical protein
MSDIDSYQNLENLYGTYADTWLPNGSCGSEVTHYYEN